MFSRASRLRLNLAVTPAASSYAGIRIDGSFRKSTPTSIRAFWPSVARARVRNRRAAGGSRLPMVEPGKNPSRRMPFTAAGRTTGSMKSAATGKIDSCVRCRIRWRIRDSASAAMSIGTYAENLGWRSASVRLNSISALVSSLAPYSTRTAGGSAAAATSGATRRSRASSVGSGNTRAVR